MPRPHFLGVPAPAAATAVKVRGTTACALAEYACRPFGPAFSPHNRVMPFDLTRRHFGPLVMAGLALNLLGACSNPAVQLLTRRSLSLSHEQLQAALAKRFPMEQRVAEVLDVRLSAPKLSLLPDSGRLATELQLDIAERLLQSTHPASLALDFGLRFEPADRTVRMHSVRVQKLVFTRLAPAYQTLMNRYAPRLAERAFDGQVLHQISEPDWNKLQMLGLQPGEFKVTPQGLSLDFLAPSSFSAPATPKR